MEFLAVKTPWKPLIISASPRGIHSVDFIENDTLVRPGIAVDEKTKAIFDQGVAWLSAYFAKDARLPPLPPLAGVGTDFQQRVWREIAAIPRGETRAYGDLARLIGTPRAARAVGQACGKNPIPILIPCHRVLAAAGKIGGYSAGIDRKRWLLAIEGWQLD